MLLGTGRYQFRIETIEKNEELTAVYTRIGNVHSAPFDNGGTRLLQVGASKCSVRYYCHVCSIESYLVFLYNDSNDAEPIEGAAELGYSSPCGPRLFDDLASQMAEDVLEITSASARRLYAAFENALRAQDSEREFVEMHPLAPLPIENDPAACNDIVVSRVVVSDDSGICPRSGAKLRLIQLESDERKQTRDSLLKLAESAYLEWNEKWGRKVERNDSALVALSQFADWLE